DNGAFAAGPLRGQRGNGRVGGVVEERAARRLEGQDVRLQAVLDGLVGSVDLFILAEDGVSGSAFRGVEGGPVGRHDDGALDAGERFTDLDAGAERLKRGP